MCAVVKKQPNVDFIRNLMLQYDTKRSLIYFYFLIVYTTINKENTVTVGYHVPYILRQTIIWDQFGVKIS